MENDPKDESLDRDKVPSGLFMPHESTSAAVLESNDKQRLEEWADMKQEARVLNRMKDFLHLISSYLMKPEAEVGFYPLKSTLFRINQQVRELEFCLARDNKYLILFRKIENGIRDARRSLAKYFDTFPEAYLPQDMVENMTIKSLALAIKPELMPSTSSSKSEEATRKLLEMLPIPQAMSNLAIEFAIRQISKCIKEGDIRKMGISGSGVEKVADALIHLPDIRSIFDVVLSISVLRHYTIKEVERDISRQINELPEFNSLIKFQGMGLHLLLHYAGQFLLLLDCIDNDCIDLHDLKIPSNGCVILKKSPVPDIYQMMNVELEMRMEDHLLPWELFCKNVGQILVDSSTLQHMAVRLIEGCHGHLLAIILIARALKDVADVSVWDLALGELTSQVKVHKRKAVVNALRFILGRKDIATKNCFEYYASPRLGSREFQKPSLVNHWIAYGLIETREQGEDILRDLINSFLLKNVKNNDSVQMQDEIKLVLWDLFRPGLHHPLQAEEWDDEERHLMNNELTELPERPICPNLQALFLQMSDDLMVIPTTFFERMPALQVLDLSYTSIKSLPQSISELVALQKFLLKGCQLLRKLPPEIGALRNLEVFDLEGTELICLAKEIGELTNLTCLKVSFFGHANRCRESNQMNAIILRTTLSKLARLKELSIDVNPDGELWDEEVKAIMNGLCSLRNLETLNLYLPTVELLQQFLQLQIYPALSHFKLTVGRLDQRIISRLPQEFEEEFKKFEKCLKYINGEGETTEITEALEHASAFFLDRHWTVKKLSEFRIDKMSQLKFCLLVECNEIQTIIDGGEFYAEGDNEEDNDDKCYESESDCEQTVLESLQYLRILYMKNLESIWEGPVGSGCLSYLKSLVLHTCPSLTTIFTLGLLGNLKNLEEIIVEDCSKINSLVSLESSCLESDCFLPRLKKISLLNLPELISISSGLCIAPDLERMIIYSCPKLESLSTMEVSSKNLKVIKGDSEWWDSLKWDELQWSKGQQDYLASIFVPFRWDEDLMAQLAEDEDSVLQPFGED